jgi:hypothetical protein
MLIYPVASNPKRVPAGGIVVVSCETRSSAGVLTTPGTSIKITIYDPSGATAKTATAMTAGSTGIYSYTYDTVTTRLGGEYTFQIETVHTDGTSLYRTNPGNAANFEVE